MANRNRVIGTLVIRAASIAAQLAFFVLLARSSSLELVGAFAITMALWVIGRALLPMGWNVAVLREATLLLAGEQFSQSRILLRTATLETVGLGLLVAAAVTGIGQLFLPISTYGIAVAASVGVLWPTVSILVSFLRASGDVLRSQLGDGLVIHVVPLMICGGLHLLGRQISLETVFVSFLISALLAVVFLLGSIKAVGGCPARTVDRDWGGVRAARLLARRLWWNQAFSALSSRAPIMLGAGLGGAVSSAVIEAGLRTQLVGATLAWAGGTVASPRYALEHSRGTSRNSLLLSAITWGTLLPTCGVVVVLGFWGEPILAILGPAYVHERLAVVLMALAAVFEAPAAAGGYFLMMSGRERVATASTLLQLVILCCFSVFLSPIGGALGIAIAVALSTLSKSVFVLICMRGLPSPLSLRGLLYLVQIVRRG
jgi:O-antigen/teichoic acid export membrane protein